MARKSRKSAPNKRRRVSTAAAQAPAQQAVAAPQAVDFAEEYRYVLSDLKRFGILAVAMFATLIVLALTIG